MAYRAYDLPKLYRTRSGVNQGSVLTPESISAYDQRLVEVHEDSTVPYVCRRFKAILGGG